MRGVAYLFCAAVFAGAVTAGCSSDNDDTEPGGTPAPEAGTDATPDTIPQESGEDSEPEAQAEGGGDAEAGAALPPGAVCTKNSECESKYCYGIFQGAANKYCTKTCGAKADCAALGPDYEWDCVNKMCAKTCTTGDSSQCKEGGCIENTDVGGGATFNLCFDLQGKLCAKDSDCADGALCQIGTGGKDFFWYCNDKPWGTLKVGETCDPNLLFGAPCAASADCKSASMTCGAQKTCEAVATAQCAGAICFDEGVCGGPCKADSDCPADYVCQRFGFQANRNDDDPANDLTGAVYECGPFAGSRTACTKDADCSNGEVCGLYVDVQNKAVMACKKPAANAIGVGEVCRDIESTLVREDTKPCKSALCAWSRCEPACVTEADCPAEHQCLEVPVTADGVAAKLCAPKACDDNAACAAGQGCVPMFTKSGELKPICYGAAGLIEAGQACDPTLAFKGASCIDDAACSTIGAGWLCNAGAHLCVPPPASACRGFTNWCLLDGFCTGVCSADADCGAAADWICSGIPNAYDNKGTGDPADDLLANIHLCIYLSGSRAACTKDADCTNGEVCRLRFSATGTVDSICAKPVPNGAAPGLPCKGGVFCTDEVCDTNDGDKDPETGTCASRCAADSDCPSPLTCQDLDFTGDGKHVLKYCRKPGAGGFSG